MKFTSGRAAAAAALAVLAAGAGAAQAQQSEGVAAVVNDEVVSTFDVRQRAGLILASAGIEPTAETLKQVRTQALRALVDERLQIQEAREYDIKIEKAAVDDALADIARSNKSSVEDLGRELAGAGSGLQTLRQQLEADLAWRRLIGGRYGSRVRISKVQIQETLDRIVANSAKPQYLVSEILLPAEKPQEFEDATQAAKRLLEEMRRGVGFSMVARQFSSAPSAAAGGDLGWLSGAELRAEVRALVDVLRPGQVSEPVRAPNGIYIIALREKREGVDPQSLARVTLKQVTAAKEARAALDRGRKRVKGCEGMEAAIGAVAGLQVLDLGEVAETELADDMRARVVQTAAGEASALFDTPSGVSTVLVCKREAVGGSVPSRDQIENRLYEQELALLSERYLRSLRRESTIITR